MSGILENLLKGGAAAAAKAVAKADGVGFPGMALPTSAPIGACPSQEGLFL
jgi:hypothetical protein